MISRDDRPTRFQSYALWAVLTTTASYAASESAESGTELIRRSYFRIWCVFSTCGSL